MHLKCIFTYIIARTLPLWNSEAFNSFGSEYSINCFNMRGRSIALQ